MQSIKVNIQHSCIHTHRMQLNDQPLTEKHCRAKDELTSSPNNVLVQLKPVILIYKRDFLERYEVIFKCLLQVNDVKCGMQKHRCNSIKR